LKELKKAAESGALDNLIGKASDLRTSLTVAEARLKEMQERLAEFHVLPQYRELEKEADQLTHQINELANAKVIDTGAIRDLETAMQSESPPPLDELKSIYAEAGISLPGLAVRRYDGYEPFMNLSFVTAVTILPVNLRLPGNVLQDGKRKKRSLTGVALL
jgi:uncharacterized protein YydD (DUF2326 family)